MADYQVIGVTYKDEVPIVWLAVPVLDDSEIVSRLCVCRTSTNPSDRRPGRHDGAVFG